MRDDQVAGVGRRRFIATAGAAATLAATGNELFLPRPASALVRVRKDIGGLAATDPIVTGYKTAVTAMQGLAPTNPLSWSYQAAIHGTTASGSMPAWNSCEHGTDWFWPWHRMYLYWFERIVRSKSGNPNWTLPFWNWTAASQLPAVFRDTTSSLYTSHRYASINAGGALPPSAVSYTTAFSFSGFTSASNSLQGSPHGAVHLAVGGWMHDVPTAAQDPIFYLHHCNVDRLWNLWLAQGGGRSDPTGDATWRNKMFTFFNEAGTAVHMRSCDVLRAALQLGYSYEGEPAQVNQYCGYIIFCCINLAVLAQLVIEPIHLTAERTVSKIDLRRVQPRLAAIAENKRQTALLRFDDVVAERQPGIYWEVYVAPAGAKLDPQGPFYVGNIALFGTGIRSEAHDQFKPAYFEFPLNRAIQAARRANGGDLAVTFVPRGGELETGATQPNAASEVTIGRASITVESVQRR